MATTYCYLLIEARRNGCQLVLHFEGVTLNQTDAYVWQQAISDDQMEVTREARQVPFLS